MPFLADEITVHIQTDSGVFKSDSSFERPVIVRLLWPRQEYRATGKAFSKRSLETGVKTALSFWGLDVVGRLLKLQEHGHQWVGF